MRLLYKNQQTQINIGCTISNIPYKTSRPTRTEMYAGRVACCLPVSYVEYAPMGYHGTDGRTDGRTPDRYITLSARTRNHKKNYERELKLYGTLRY